MKVPPYPSCPGETNEPNLPRMNKGQHHEFPDAKGQMEWVPRSHRPDGRFSARSQEEFTASYL